MRKLKMLILSLVALLPTLKAQKPFSVENVTAGIMLTGALDYSKPKEHNEGGQKIRHKPVEAFYDISPSINVETNKTVHRVMYNIFSGYIQTLNCIKLKHHMDIYLSYGKSLNSNGSYLYLGIEKVIRFPSVKWIGCEFFFEAGTNFSYPSFAGGVVLHPEIILWKKKQKSSSH